MYISILSTTMEKTSWNTYCDLLQSSPCSRLRRHLGQCIVLRMLHNSPFVISFPTPSINVERPGMASGNMTLINIYFGKGGLFLQNRENFVNLFFHDCRSQNCTCTHLPKFEFLANFSIGLNVILQKR